MSNRLHLGFINAAHFAIHYLLLIFPTAALAIEKDWQSSYADVLSLGTAALVIFGLATLPAGWLGDRLPKTWLMSAFFLGGGSAAMLTGFAAGPLPLAAGLAMVGFFCAIYHPVGLAMISELSEAQGQALAINGVFGNLGLAGAAIATGALAESFGWRTAFLLPGFVIVVIGVVYASLFGRRIALGPSNRIAKSHVAVSRNAQLRIVGLVAVSALFGGLIFNGVTVSLPKVMEERLSVHGLDLTLVGSTTALVFAIAAFSQLPVGRALDRMGAKPVLLVLLSVQGLAMLLLANSAGPSTLVLSIVLVTAIFAEIPVTSWLLARFVAPNWRSRAYSLEYVFALGISSAIIPLISHLHAGGQGFRTLFLSLTGAAAIVLCAALFLPSTRTQTARGAA
jgi:MFS family permease